MEEEKLKKAIDLLKSEISVYDTYYCLATSQALKTVLNELENLQKENEYLKTHIIYPEIIKLNFIPKQLIRDKIKELSKYRDLAKELIEHKIVVADSDSLNYGRAEAHDKDIQVLKELLGDK